MVQLHLTKADDGVREVPLPVGDSILGRGQTDPTVVLVAEVD